MSAADAIGADDMLQVLAVIGDKVVGALHGLERGGIDGPGGLEGHAILMRDAGAELAQGLDLIGENLATLTEHAGEIAEHLARIATVMERGAQ